jgi:hypothetical protein
MISSPADSSLFPQFNKIGGLRRKVKRYMVKDVFSVIPSWAAENIWQQQLRNIFINRTKDQLILGTFHTYKT